MNKVEKCIVKFCTGCGLCSSVKGVELKEDAKGFSFPVIKSYEDFEFCKKVCPAVQKHNETRKTIWGNYEFVYAGWSSDKNIRKMASSGGVISATLKYLLDFKLVDVVIQSAANRKQPWKTETYCHSNPDNIIEFAGSRYSISHTLSDINRYLNDESIKRIAFVGRPCEVSALRNYMKMNSVAQNKIKYVLSFFCGGIPSERANLKLIDAVGCEIDKLVKLSYRGNGWPGYYICTDSNGKRFMTSYNDSWGKYLGRDVAKACRFCIDSLGEDADIACGDAWHQNSDGTPDFSEGDGRNVVLVRTKNGADLFTNMQLAGYVITEPYDIGRLFSVQKSQYTRKSTMLGKWLALKLCNKTAPNYSLKCLLRLAKFCSVKDQFKAFKGTITRIKKGVI